jgi:thiol-disulfide isomerase/thioredoxin
VNTPSDCPPVRPGRRGLPAGPAGPGGETALAPGQRIGRFTTTTVNETLLDQEDLAEGTVVAFLSPSCGPCAKALPKFMRYAEGRAEPDSVFAVVLDEGDADTAAATDVMVQTLRQAANVVRERLDGPMSKAFAVTGFPAFILVGQNQVVAAGGLGIEDLPVPREPALRTGRA